MLYSVIEILVTKIGKSFYFLIEVLNRTCKSLSSSHSLLSMDMKIVKLLHLSFKDKYIDNDILK